MGPSYHPLLKWRRRDSSPGSRHILSKLLPAKLSSLTPSSYHHIYKLTNKYHIYMLTNKQTLSFNHNKTDHFILFHISSRCEEPKRRHVICRCCSYLCKITYIKLPMQRGGGLMHGYVVPHKSQIRFRNLHPDPAMFFGRLWSIANQQHRV